MGCYIWYCEEGTRDWPGPQPAQAPSRCTKCNSPPIRGRGATESRGSIAPPPTFSGAGSTYGALPLTFCRVHLCCSCSHSFDRSFIHSFIHSVIRKLAYGFLFTFNSNYSRIFSHFGDASRNDMTLISGFRLL